MISIQLSEEEAALLAQSLEWWLSETRMEICDTDSADFRDRIKQEKAIIESVLAQLKQHSSV
jgi:hypothetical protein